MPILARHFIERAVEQKGLPRRAIADDAMAMLKAYNWPGNVRQLRNVVDWLLIMAPGEPQEPIRAEMLPADIGSISHPTGRSEFDGEIMSVPLREARELFERRYLDAQVTPLRRQHREDRHLRRHGALGALSQAAGARHRFQRAVVRGLTAGSPPPMIASDQPSTEGAACRDMPM